MGHCRSSNLSVRLCRDLVGPAAVSAKSEKRPNNSMQRTAVRSTVRCMLSVRHTFALSQS